MRDTKGPPVRFPAGPSPSVGAPGAYGAGRPGRPGRARARPPGPYVGTDLSCAGKATASFRGLRRRPRRAGMRPWETTKHDRKIHCQWGRLRSEAWVTHSCANSAPR
ncbi:hypothetical protein FNJ62_19155 [Streptomyces benahoarensis]|uniref:Uncharacterized protein n=1 Tax=Streptomyces benahoarensis TaxID=2595054 RepID=A0A553ZEP3_9ACTN|nr:hypothetical protein FNJ62_19155 [Streptomyces benahoarensis]TSB39895.1 hypothetical protein FNZ23_14755 [Streptomyces benahoarensis]